MICGWWIGVSAERRTELHPCVAHVVVALEILQRGMPPQSGNNDGLELGSKHFFRLRCDIWRRRTEVSEQPEAREQHEAAPAG